MLSSMEERNFVYFVDIQPSTQNFIQYSPPLVHPFPNPTPTKSPKILPLVLLVVERLGIQAFSAPSVRSHFVYRIVCAHIMSGTVEIQSVDSFFLAYRVCHSPVSNLFLLPLMHISTSHQQDVGLCLVFSWFRLTSAHSNISLLPLHTRVCVLHC